MTSENTTPQSMGNVDNTSVTDVGEPLTFHLAPSLVQNLVYVQAFPALLLGL